jgi:periplasmic copper chaperone A
MTARLLLGALLLAVGLYGTASAAEDKHVAKAGDLRVVHVWTRATNNVRRPADVFMEVESSGGADRLVGAACEFADKVEIVGLASKADGSAVPVGSADVPERGRLVLEPNGLAIRLEGLRRALKQGQDFRLRVTFEKAGSVGVTGEVMAANARQHGHAGHRH